MVGVMVAKSADSLDGLLEIDRLAERFIFDCMGYDRFRTIVVHIYFYTFQSSFEVLNVSLDFRVTGKLIAWEIGVVWWVTIVISKRKAFIDFLRNYGIISLFTEQIAAEIIETYLFFSFLDYFIDSGFIFLLVKYKKLPEGFSVHQRSEIVNVSLQSGIGVFLEEDFHFLAAVDDFKVVTNFVMSDLCRICESLRIYLRYNCFKNLPVPCLIINANQLRYFQHIRCSFLPWYAVLTRLHCVKLHDPRKVRRIDMG